MNRRHTQTAHLLEELFHDCLKGEAAYHTAFSEAKDSDLRYLFSSYSMQRAKLARELGAALAVMGFESDEGEPMEIDDGLSPELAPRSNQILLAECARREEGAIHLYRKALEEELPETLRVLLLRQQREIEVTRERLQQLYSLAQPT